MRYQYKKIDHSRGGNAVPIISGISSVFSLRDGRLKTVKNLSQEVATLVLSMGAAQQGACAAVCPGCRSVCCINRHAYHEHEDIVYLGALDAEMPSYHQGVADADPCQFLAEQGCTISRQLRPHRCNAYFCSPMLEYLEIGPAHQYRQFIHDLERINRKREEMLEEFYDKACSSNPSPAPDVFEAYLDW